MPVSSFFSGLPRFAGQVYGRIDRAVGGILPGGSDNPYIGRSRSAPLPQSTRDALAQGTDVARSAAIALGLDQANPLLNAAVDKLSSRTQVPLGLIERAQKFVEAQLPTKINVKIKPDETGSGGWFHPISGVGLDIRESPGNKGTQYTTSAPIALHEFGHALNFAEPYPRSLAFKKSMPFNTGLIGGLSTGTSDDNDARSVLTSGVQGALENVLAPGMRHTLVEEGLATRNAWRMANQFGLPAGKGLLSAAWGTYATPPLASGFLQGMVGELGARGTRRLANTITDQVLDPLADKLKGSEYTPMEESLRRYGYSEATHRLRARQDGSVQIETK